MRNNAGEVLELPSTAFDNESQYNLVYDTFSVNRHKFMTLEDLRAITGIDSVSSIASRIRDLRTEGVNIQKRLNDNLSVGRKRVYEYCWSF